MRYEEREFITMYQIDYTNVGKRMKTLRKQAGYTQEQIADALDVTVAFISNIENDRVKMNLREQRNSSSIGKILYRRQRKIC